MKRYQEPMAHGPEACEPSQAVRKPLTPAVGGTSLFSNPRDLESDPSPLNQCRMTIILLSQAILGRKSVKYPISTVISNCHEIAA